MLFDGNRPETFYDSGARAPTAEPKLSRRAVRVHAPPSGSGCRAGCSGACDRARGRPQYLQELVSAPFGAVASMCFTISGSTRCAHVPLFSCIVYSAGPPV